MSRRHRRVGVLVLVLAVAFLHAAAQTRLRPLYQVPDEMAYLRAAQELALGDAPELARRCIAPPDGQLLALGEGGKAGFRHVSAWQLGRLCRSGGDGLPLSALRLWQALALPLVALAAWTLARQLSGSLPAALMAALLVAIHPVAAALSAGVTPDAWANAWAAWALVFSTRIVADRHRWWDLPAMAACVVVGLLWKDTLNFLVPLTACAGAIAAFWWFRRLPRDETMPRVTVVGLVAVAAAIAVVLVVWASPAGAWSSVVTPYFSLVEGNPLARLGSPWRFVVAVVDDAVGQAFGFAASSLLSLYRPLVHIGDAPWRQALTPVGAAVVLVALYAGGTVGAARAMLGARDGVARLPGAVVAWWGLALVLCALQPSIRSALLDMPDVYQGRWLLPILAPAAAFGGIGLARLARGAAAVPLAVVLGLGSLWVIVADVVRHYYVRLPDLLDTRVLFVRPTGDADVGDATILALVQQTAAAQSAWVTWGILVLLAATTAWLAWVASRPDLPVEPHG